MSVQVFDDVLSIEDAKTIENFVLTMKYRWGAKSLTQHHRYYPFELPKGLKWGDWEPQSPGNFHWISKFGMTEDSLKTKNHDIILQLWKGLYTRCKLRERFGVEQLADCYVNVHTYGQAPYLHQDPGNFTMIYYPQLNWDEKEWGGGTTIWEPEIQEIDQIENLEVLEHVPYKGNRLVVFDAWHMHRGEPVSRTCKEARYVIVFKTIAHGGNNERLDFYNG